MENMSPHTFGKGNIPLSFTPPSYPLLMFHRAAPHQWTIYFLSCVKSLFTFKRLEMWPSCVSEILWRIFVQFTKVRSEVSQASWRAVRPNMDTASLAQSLTISSFLVIYNWHFIWIPFISLHLLPFLYWWLYLAFEFYIVSTNFFGSFYTPIFQLFYWDGDILSKLDVRLEENTLIIRFKIHYPIDYLNRIYFSWHSWTNWQLGIKIIYWVPAKFVRFWLQLSLVMTHFNLMDRRTRSTFGTFVFWTLLFVSVLLW